MLEFVLEVADDWGVMLVLLEVLTAVVVVEVLMGRMLLEEVEVVRMAHG